MHCETIRYKVLRLSEIEKWAPLEKDVYFLINKIYPDLHHKSRKEVLKSVSDVQLRLLGELLYATIGYSLNSNIA